MGKAEGILGLVIREELHDFNGNRLLSSYESARIFCAPLVIKRPLEGESTVLPKKYP